MQRLNLRVCGVAELPASNECERTQWYFERYAAQLPTAGEFLLFDRSWYNRARVERVMGFFTEAECEEFFRPVPEFERMLVRSGIMLLKYWFSISDEHQQARLHIRIDGPLSSGNCRRWTSSRARWEDYTRGKEGILTRTNIPETRSWIVEADDKKRARPYYITHLLEQAPYQDAPREPVALPERFRHDDYARRTFERQTNSKTGARPRISHLGTD